MPEESQRLSTPLSEPTDARFSMRAMLIVTAVVAVMAALAGAYAQRFPPDAQRRLSIFWANWLIVSILWLGFMAHRRVQAERSAGRTLLRLPIGVGSMNSGIMHASVITYPLTILFLLYITSGEIADPKPRRGVSDWVLELGLPIFGSVWAAAIVIPALTWQRSVRFCEHGVLWNQQLLPWDHLIERQWLNWLVDDKPKLELRGLDARGADFLLQIPVAKDQRLSVDAILAERATRRPSLPAGTQTSAMGRLPISTVFGTTHLRHHLWAVMAGVLFALGLVYLAIWHPTGVPEFDHSIYWGVYLFVFLSAWKWHWQWAGKRTGAVVVRIFARRDWIGLLLTAGTAIGVYIAGSRFGWSSAWLAYAGGIAYCYLTIQTGAYFILTQLDLCENGLFMQGATYWPWTRVRVVTWDRESNGRLVFKRGWRRIVAIVSPEQRGAVDAVLKEKLRTDVTRADY